MGYEENRMRPPPITTASFYHYECDCGSNFPVEENLINEKETRCPSCKKVWNWDGGDE